MNFPTQPHWLATLPSDVVEITNPHGANPVLLVCEHASSHIPEGLARLGLAQDAAQSHIAWDPGAKDVALGLAQQLDATLVSHKISRLVYDCNRPPESDQAIRAQSEIYEIPGNVGLTREDQQARIDYIYRPFQNAIAKQVENRAKTVLVTIHSFTPIYNGVTRDVEIGILHDSDSRLADAMLDAATKTPLYSTERNAPYGPDDGVTHTLKEHAQPNGHLNVMIEIRNDLVSDAQGVKTATEWLYSILTTAMNKLDVAE